MDIPTAVDVVGQKFRILHDAPSDNGSGECHTDENLIRVNPQHGEPAQRDTLLHEVCHAISDAMQCDMRERQIRGMATGLLCVLRQNPNLVNFLTEP